MEGTDEVSLALGRLASGGGGGASSSSSSFSSSATASPLPPLEDAASLPPDERAAAVPALALRRVVDSVQNYLTLRLMAGHASPMEIAPPVALLAALHAANEEYALLHGGRRALAPQAFVSEFISRNIDLQRDFSLWARDGRRLLRGGGRSFSFCAYPFLFDAAAKSAVLGFDAQLQQSAAAHAGAAAALFSGGFFGGGGGGGAGAPSPFFMLHIRRERMLEDALQGIVNQPDRAALKKPLRVVFAGEEGIDAGGVKREFFALIFRQLMSPDFGMFREEGRLAWFNGETLEPPINFELVGCLCGMAAYNGVLLDVHFPLVVYKKLRGEPLALSDLDDFQPALARSLRALLAHAADDVEEVFGLDWTATTEAFGERRVVELAPGGAARPVTRANARAYVHAYLNWLLGAAVARPFDAFRRGFLSVAAGPALDLFRAEELSLLIAGGDELDFVALQHAARYEAPFSAEHRAVRWLWAAVHAMPPDKQRLFLSFTTGSDRAPIRGLGDLRLIVQRAGPDSEALPTASTCFNTLLLP